MSDLRSSDYDDDQDSRSRAVWGLAALGIIALLIMVALLLIGGSGGHHHSSPPPLLGLSSEPAAAPTTKAPTSTTARPGSVKPTSRAATSPPTTARTSIPPAPTSTANPCPGGGACPVAGDAGQLVAAVNAFRASHGRPPVAGTVSPQAQQCAMSQGDGPACSPSWAWEPVPNQDGAKAVELLAGRSSGWLLDPAMKSFSVGWAYAPGTGYECAILKIA